MQTCKIVAEGYPDKGLVIHRVFGRVQLDDAKAHTMYGWVDFPTPYVIWDLREGSCADIDIDGFKELARWEKHAVTYQGEHKVAVVVNTDLEYGLIRAQSVYYEIHDIQADICPFRSMGEAMSWIDGHSDSGCKPERPDKR